MLANALHRAALHQSLTSTWNANTPTTVHRLWIVIRLLAALAKSNNSVKGSISITMMAKCDASDLIAAIMSNSRLDVSWIIFGSAR